MQCWRSWRSQMQLVSNRWEKGAQPGDCGACLTRGQRLPAGVNQFSETNQRRREQALEQSGIEAQSAAKRGGLERRAGPRLEVCGNTAPIRSSQALTNGPANQWRELVWLLR